MMVTRLEIAAACSLRRKPYGKEGNHRVLLSATVEMFQMLTWDSELHALHYEDICEGLGESRLDRGTAAHMQKVWGIARERLLHCSSGTESKNSRWWSIEVQFREGKPMRPMNAMLLSFVGWRRRWY